MSQPQSYSPQHSFVSDSATLANFPGQAFDIEFNAVKATTDQIRTNLAFIQRDDGHLANASVDTDQLSTTLQAALLTTTTGYQLILAAQAAAAGSATAAAGSATAAASSATTAQSYAAALSGTLTSSVAIATGSKSFTASASKAWTAGQFLLLSSNANSANYMHGSATSYNSTTGALVVNVLDVGGSGTFADWNIAISGPQGPTGVVSETGTPSANQFATWSGSTAIQGVSITGLVKGNGASAPTAAVAGTDYLAPAAIGTTVQAFDAQLFSNVPQQAKSAAYTTVLTDGEKHILHPAADNNPRTFTIDSNANVPYPIGTAITFVNQNGAGTVTIAITSDTMRLAGSGSTGSRTLAANGVATALKIAATEWIISGTGLT